MIKKIEFNPIKEQGDDVVTDGMVTMEDGKTRDFSLSSPKSFGKSAWQLQKMILERISATLEEDAA